MHTPRLKACGQGSEAPAHLQLRQCAPGTHVREGREAGVADLVEGERELLALRQCPSPALGDGLDRLSKHGDAGVTDLIFAKSESGALRQCPVKL